MRSKKINRGLSPIIAIKEKVVSIGACSKSIESDLVGFHLQLLTPNLPAILLSVFISLVACTKPSLAGSLGDLDARLRQSSGIKAVEVTSTQQLQNKHPNVWLRIFPDATKLLLLGMYSYSINTLYPDGTIVKHPDVLMRVRKINEHAEYLISFFNKKEYLIDDKTLTNIPITRHLYKAIEIDGDDPISTVATKLLDGSWLSIHSRYNSNSRWSYCMPVDQRIARLSIKNDKTGKSELNLNQIKVEWMKSIIVKIDKNDEEESCHGFKKHDSVIRDFIDLNDGTLLLQGAQYIIRIRIADGSSFTNSPDIKIVDDKNATEFYSYIWHLDKCWAKQNVRYGKPDTGIPMEELAISYFFDHLKFINNIKKECSHGDH